MDYEEANELLQTYRLEDILELNDITPEETLCFLVDQEFIKLPEILPL